MTRESFLRTRVGARVLALFVLGAVLPVCLLALLSHRAVSRQLVEQSQVRMAERTSESGQWVLGRLSELTRWVEAAYGNTAPGGVVQRPFVPVPGVVGLAEVQGRSVIGSAGAFDAGAVELEESDWTRLEAGGAILRPVGPASEGGALLVLRGQASEHSLWARLQLDSVWSSAMVLGADGNADDLCFLSAEREAFACMGGTDSDLAREAASIETGGGTRGLLEYRAADGDEVLGSWREIYLRAAFDTEPWLVVTSERASVVLAPASAFTTNFFAALAVGVLLVVFLANSIVRRTLEPLGALAAGTKAVAAREFGARVEIDSEDEFAELAGAFNTMASSLEVQFQQLHASQAIDRAVVERGDREAAVGGLIDGLTALLPIRRVAVMLFDVDHEGTDVVCFRDSADDGDVHTVSLPPTDGLPGWVPADADWLPASSQAHRYLRHSKFDSGDDHLFAIPMKLEGESVGVTIVSASPMTTLEAPDLLRARGLVRRATVAVNEVRLRRELAETSADALTVLANAIDAKSRWTAGHSQRVTALADAIGRRVELPPQELDILHRGGLLHDIGKIGVPQSILDFPGRLSDEQFATVKTHPRVGVTILEPMKVFRPILPIVLHHHERWDGRGYPDGLAGHAIPTLARIMTVADVFDAMITPRPYRDALSKEFVVNHIREQSGEMFDPELVDAFLEVIRAGWQHDKVVPGSVFADVSGG